MKPYFVASVLMFWTLSASANPCLDRFKDLVPALKEAKFIETGKGEKDYWKVPAEQRDEKVFRSNIYAQLSGEAWGSGDRDSIKSIAKSNGPKGENTLYRKRDNSAVLIAGLGEREPTVVRFDNVSCKITSIRFYEMKKNRFVVEDYQRLAYMDPKFCEFIEKNRGSLSRLPKDFNTYNCEELNCGTMNRTTGYCMCNDAEGKSRPMTKPCCANGVAKENHLLKTQDEYRDAEMKLDWEDLSAELVARSHAKCQKWKSLFTGLATPGKPTKPVSQ